MTAMLSRCCFNSAKPQSAPYKRPTEARERQTSNCIIKPRVSGLSPVTKKKQFKNLKVTKTLAYYLDSGQIGNALCLFEKMDHWDTYMCNVMLRGLTDHGLFQEAVEIYQRMELQGIQADNFTYTFVVKSVGGLSSQRLGDKIHGKLIKAGLDLDLYICNSLILTYANLGFIEFAEKVFGEASVRDLVTWNSMLSGYVSVGDGWSSLICYRKMLESGVGHDRFTMINALASCSLECLERSGKEIHCQVLRCCFENDAMVETSLIHTYGRCGNIDYAERLFNKMPLRGLVAWNAMIDAYALNSHPLKSLACLETMQETDHLNPDSITLLNLLPSCAKLEAILEGKSIHGYAIRKVFLPDAVLETGLLHMYGECGDLKSASNLFGQMKEPNIVSWNALIAAYVQNGASHKALELFLKFLSKPLQPDAVTIASILPAYPEFASLREGKQIHGYSLKLGQCSNSIIWNSAVYMYANCGDLDSARKVFDQMMFKDVISWNTIIMAYGMHGFGRTSLELFSEMREKGMKPNESTFVSLLSSCSISGMHNEGWELFKSMKMDFRINRGIEHYGCMLDLLGRSGDLDQAKAFIDEMPMAPTARIWGSLLTASRNHENLELAELAADHILSMEHDNTGCYMSLRHLYSKAGRWKDVERIKSLMNREGLVKTAGFSLVETEFKIHRFKDRDMSHSETNMIYNVLDILSSKTWEDRSTSSTTKFAISDLGRSRSKPAMSHSVRLAICYGLISTKVGRLVLVRKNLRVCEDCHSFAKQVSVITKREIIVGDSKIFHHFRGGVCSCGDYW